MCPQNNTQVGSFAELDKLTSDNKDKLIVVDYSTTWCGPCKMILPKFEALAEEYADAIFVKVGENPRKDIPLRSTRRRENSVYVVLRVNVYQHLPSNHSHLRSDCGVCYTLGQATGRFAPTPKCSTPIPSARPRLVVHATVRSGKPAFSAVLPFLVVEPRAVFVSLLSSTSGGRCAGPSSRLWWRTAACPWGAWPPERMQVCVRA